MCLSILSLPVFYLNTHPFDAENLVTSLLWERVWLQTSGLLVEYCSNRDNRIFAVGSRLDPFFTTHFANSEQTILYEDLFSLENIEQ